MAQTTQFSKSLLDAVDVDAILPVDSREAMTLDEWCEVKGRKCAAMQAILEAKVADGILVEVVKYKPSGRPAKAWGLKK